jgi:lysophospholipid hydrolase
MNLAAGIVQVILLRFQRVTFYSLYRYLGLSRELLRIENLVNFANLPIPVDFMQGEFDESLEKLREGASGSRDSPSDLHSEYTSDFHNTLFEEDLNSSPEDFKFKFPDPRGELGGDVYEGDVDTEEFPHPRKIKSHFMVGGSTNQFDEEEEVKMKLACYDLIMDYIGFVPAMSSYSASISSKTSVSSIVGKLADKDISDMLGSPRRGSNVFHSRRFSVDSEDGMSTTGSVSQSACGDPFMEVEIRRVPAGEILIEEGDRFDGLYYIIDGRMEARMKSRVDELGMSAFGGKHKEKSFSFKKSGGLIGYLSCLTGEF